MTTRRRDAGARPRDARGGFTFIEVMVALAVVAIAFVGLLGLHNQQLILVGRDQDLTRATLLAQELFAQLELAEALPDLGLSSGQVEAYPGFRWEQEVRETELDAVREVRLRVIWDERIPDACSFIYYAVDHRDAQNR